MPILIEHTDHNVCEKFFAALSIETGKENRLDWHRTEVKIVRLFINKNNSCKESLIASSRTCLVSRTFDLHCVELTTIGKPQASPNNYLLEKMFWTITTLNYFNWTWQSTINYHNSRALNHFIHVTTMGEPLQQSSHRLTNGSDSASARERSPVQHTYICRYLHISLGAIGLCSTNSQYKQRSQWTYRGGSQRQRLHSISGYSLESSKWAVLLISSSN